jgi:uncharacterized membrane protein
MMILRNVLLAVHLLSAVIWVGGGFYAIVVLRPALALLDAGPRLQVQMQTLKKLFFYIWHAMPLMILTGWGMVFLAWGGFAALPLSINAMQGLGILMALIFAYTFFDPWKRVQRAVRPTPEMVTRVRNLVTLNVILGVVTITAGALGHTW